MFQLPRQYRFRQLPLGCAGRRVPFGDWEIATIAIYSMKMRKTTPRGAPTGMRRPLTVKVFRRSPDVSPASPPLSLSTRNDHLLIVGHQGVLSLLIAQLLSMPDAAMWHFPIEHGAWSLVDLQPDFTTCAC